MDAHHERMMARMDSQLQKIGATLDDFEEGLNKMDTTDLEANRESRRRQRSSRTPLKKRQRWKLSKHCRTHMGTDIEP
jgi:hypothetical protein